MRSPYEPAPDAAMPIAQYGTNARWPVCDAGQQAFGRVVYRIAGQRIWPSEVAYTEVVR